MSIQTTTILSGFVLLAVFLFVGWRSMRRHREKGAGRDGSG